MTARLGVVALILAIFAGPAERVAAETTTYRYDVFGRLQSSFRRDGPLTGLSTKIAHDAADNRRSYNAQNVIHVLHTGDSIYSLDNRFELVMQADGNLVLYQVGVAPLWATATSGSNYWAVFQSDGNLVVYTSANSPVWASNTGGNWGSDLRVQNDGNMAIYNEAGSWIWQAGTCCH